MQIDVETAKDIIRAEAAALENEGFDEKWAERIEEFSKRADGARTHIAFLGVALVSKATTPAIDLYGIKPDHDPNNPRTYPARTVGEDVLVPMAAELAFHLGVTARQPLNNMPYFRISRIGDDTAMSKRRRVAYEYLLEIIKELDATKDGVLARKALRAYIAVRRKYQPKYVVRTGTIHVLPEKLADVAERFVRENSEGGRRAQAVVAGMMDAVVGPDRVESGRINDPSRKYPGDVCIHVVSESDEWEKAFEVRDKPVSFSDVQVFGKKCADMGVREAAIVMAAEKQHQLDAAALSKWASDVGIGLTLFYGISSIVSQALFWAPSPKPDAAVAAASFVYQRLLAIEASPSSVDTWNKLVSS